MRFLRNLKIDPDTRDLVMRRSCVAAIIGSQSRKDAEEMLLASPNCKGRRDHQGWLNSKYSLELVNGGIFGEYTRPMLIRDSLRTIFASFGHKR